MTKLDVINRLRTQRENLQDVIFKDVQKTIIESARAGYFPDFSCLLRQIMSKVAEQMIENPNASIDEWIVVLQAKEPNKFCERTVSIIEKLCQKK